MKIKDFIYLDTDFLNSYLSQIENGLISNMQTETSIGNTSNETENTQVSMGATMKVNLGIISAGIKDDPIYKQAAFNESESARELTNKVLHDYAYQKFRDYLSKDGSLIADEIGGYVEMSGEFNILDMPLFSDDMLNTFEEIQKNQILELKSRIKSLSGPEKTLAQLKINGMENSTSFAGAKAIFNIIKSFFPTNILMQHNNYFCFLNPNFFRQPTKGFALRYEENLHVLGRITKKGLPHSAGSNPSDNSVLSSLSDFQGSLIDAINSLGFNYTENAYIVSPIAIYFE